MRNVFERSDSKDATILHALTDTVPIGQRPGFTPQEGHRLADGQVEPLNEGGLDQARQAGRFQFGHQSFAFAP